MVYMVTDMIRANYEARPIGCAHDAATLTAHNTSLSLSVCIALTKMHCYGYQTCRYDVAVSRGLGVHLTQYARSKRLLYYGVGT